MIEIKNLSIKLGDFALKDINLTIYKGEYFVILGPTGCGKTMLIECLSGIRRPDSGEIWIDGRNITETFPEERNIGYLPQDFALFPHMTVKENIAFGPKAKKRSGDQIEKLTYHISESLGITELLPRRIRGLSGGERQRVALARALATEPKAVFLDEPLSALDEDTRERLAAELRNIHDRFKTTFIHISHNLEEIAQVADRVALMNKGTIEQTGTVNEILRFPVSRYAAEFTRTKNIFEGNAESRNDGFTRVSIGKSLVLNSRSGKNGKVLAAIRPEMVRISDSSFENSENVFYGTIKEIQNRGVMTKLTIDIGAPLSVCTLNSCHEDKAPQTGDKVYIQIPPDSVHLIRL